MKMFKVKIIIVTYLHCVALNLSFKLILVTDIAYVIFTCCHVLWGPLGLLTEASYI